MPQSHSDIEAKLRLRHTYIEEDADEINTLIVSVKLESELTDSEVIYFMREGKNWSKRVENLIIENRKFQLEAYGVASLADICSSLDQKVKNVKVAKDNKLVAISKEHESRGLSSLCENKNKMSVASDVPANQLI